MTPATRGLGKDRLPALTLSGTGLPRSTMRLCSVVKELDNTWPSLRTFWEHRELAEAHDKCQVIPEASIDALKEQLAAAQQEKDQLIQRHREELSAQKTSYQELKSQLIQLGFDHAKALKAAETDAAAKMDEARRTPAMPSWYCELSWRSWPRPGRVLRESCAAEEEHRECNQLILQTDTLAYRLFPDSHKYAVKKVDARRTTQGQANLAVPWTPTTIDSLNARVSHMRAIDRNLSDIPDVATQLFRTCGLARRCRIPSPHRRSSQGAAGRDPRVAVLLPAPGRLRPSASLALGTRSLTWMPSPECAKARKPMWTRFSPLAAGSCVPHCGVRRHAHLHPSPPDVEDYLDEEEDEADEEPLNDWSCGGSSEATVMLP
ncbi:hypothetical protein QYE76_027800 [Lolium multiflorum]|uniref:Uncharacterized protein n=1 Tax=Lolium multiflorum TaxID=4521 RepID=A0AAD8VDY0_LOLMU|nr:hypothetical protein QYE76_027800 [Lolium multiflorum]